MTMTQSKARKVRPKLVPISSSAASAAGKSSDNDTTHFYDSFSRSFDDGGLGFGEILTAAPPTATDAPVTNSVVSPAEGQMEIGHNDDTDSKHISDKGDNRHMLDHVEDGVTVTGIGGAAAAGAAKKLEAEKNLSSSGDDDSSTDNDDDDDDSVSSSEPESEPSNVMNHHQRQQGNCTTVDYQLQQLQSEIQYRQKLLSKLLRGKEGTAYAAMIQRQETLVNSQLMDNLRRKGRVTKPSSTSSAAVVPAISSDSGTRTRITIRSILLDDFHNTLPGAMSLVIHCILYITTYALIVKFVNLLCDTIIIRFTGWDIKTNDFDCTHYEHAFHVILLILSLLASRITGVVYDWNDNKMYQKRIAFQLRNKWILKFWDAKLLNFFNDDSTRMKYEYIDEDLSCLDVGNREVASRGDNTTTTTTTTAATITSSQHHRRSKRMLGWRLKYMIDLFSFFFCYKSVEYFLHYGCLIPLSEITDSVWANLPSRQQQLQQQESIHQWSRRAGSHTDFFDCEFDYRPGRKVQPGVPKYHYHLDSETTVGVSYACHNVKSALGNPYALDMLTWIAGIDTESEVVVNWIANAMNCGWSGVAARSKEYDSPADMMAYSSKDQLIISTDGFEEDVDNVTSGGVEHHQTCIFPRQIREEERNNDERDHHDVSYYPEKRRISAQDDNYIQSIISREAYYEFIRNPNPRFFDSTKEHLFLFVTTSICLGLLYICDIPFLLI